MVFARSNQSHAAMWQLLNLVLVLLLFVGTGMGDPDTMLIKLPTVRHEYGTSGAKLVKAKKVERPEVPTFVTVNGGKLRGKIAEDEGFKYHSFLSIPYGEVVQRFRPAVPSKPWRGTLNATQHREPCVMFYGRLQMSGGVEDCLHLSVLTPNTKPPGGLMPVMVLIHGGKFKFGNARIETTNPVRFLRRGIVYVAMEYRLGVHGFLNLGTKDAPGNVGLKDIVLALRWVRANVRRFGGDPNNVSLYGMSSGGIAAGLLTLAPHTRGLFSKVILHSSATSTIGDYRYNPVRRAYRLAKRFGASSFDTPAAVAARLRDVPALDLVRVADQMANELLASEVGCFFEPSVEYDLPGERAIIRDHWLATLKDPAAIHHVPTMIMTTDCEGLIAIEGWKDFDTWKTNAVRSIFEFLPTRLMDGALHPDAVAERIDRIARQYLKGRPIEYETARDALDVITEGMLYTAVYEYWQRMRHGMRSPVYVSQFAYDANVAALHKDKLNISGVSHMEDMVYLFKTNTILADKMAVTPTVKLVSDRMVTMVVNFCYTGNPTPRTTKLLPVRWSPLKREGEFRYLKITDKLKMEKKPYDVKFKFWNKLFEEIDRDYAIE